MKVTLTLTEEMLATRAANKDVFSDFIASKAPDDDKRKEELDTAEHREEAGTTVFATYPVSKMKERGYEIPYGSIILPFQPEKTIKTNGEPKVIEALPDRVVGIFNYAIKGFFKDAAGSLNRMDKEFRNGLEKLTAFKTKIDSLIFVTPRFIPIVFPDGATIGICERPLRADTAQGPRVSVCRSETAPEGSSLTFDIDIRSKALEVYIKAWLDYGKHRGLGCWRNSSCGSFTWKEISQEAKA